jgi:hypothetical protein
MVTRTIIEVLRARKVKALRAFFVFVILKDTINGPGSAGTTAPLRPSKRWNRRANALR